MADEFEQTSLSDMLNDEPSNETTPEPEQSERPRDSNGRFAKKGDDDDGAPPAPDQRDEFDGAATVAERRKRQDAERERDEYRQRLDALESKFNQIATPQQEQPAVPDMFEDPVAWQNHLTSQFQQALYLQKRDVSERLARKEYGDDVVERAKQWAAQRCEQDPMFNQQALSSDDPMGLAVQKYREQEVVSSVTPDELAAFRAWQAAQGQQVQQQPGLPPTLSTERNAGQRTGPQWAGPTSLADMLK